MAGALPSLFGKLFVIGFALPALVLLCALVGISDVFWPTGVYRKGAALLLTVNEKQLALSLGVLVSAVWAIAVLLMAMNVAIIRLLEGYGSVNPAQLLRWRSVHAFRTLTSERDRLVEERKSPDLSPEKARKLQSRYGVVLQRLAMEFPEREDLVLATLFGNTIRAFERYPQTIYGMDSIQTWNRLQAVITEPYRNLLDDAKAQLDLWVNLWLVSVVAAFASAAASAVFLQWKGLLPATIGLLLAMMAANCARSLAGQWGALVKGAFDLYRLDLGRQLGFEIPRSIVHEREMWKVVSQTMVFGLARYADSFTQFRPLDRERLKKPK